MNAILALLAFLAGTTPAIKPADAPCICGHPGDGGPGPVDWPPGKITLNGMPGGHIGPHETREPK